MTVPAMLRSDDAREPFRSEMENCGSRSTKGRNTSSIFCGYNAYFGTYTVAEGQRVVTHHLEGALSLDDVGKDLHRSFDVTADRLTITFSTTSPRAYQSRGRLCGSASVRISRAEKRNHFGSVSGSGKSWSYSYL